MNRIRNIQILFLLGAAALLSACTSVTTTVPSGRAPAFEARADQVVVIDPADVAAELHTQVEPLLAETAGRDRVIVVSYSLAPSDETLRSVLDFIKMRTAPGDIVKVERDFIAHLGLAVTVRDRRVFLFPIRVRLKHLPRSLPKTALTSFSRRTVRLCGPTSFRTRTLRSLRPW